MFCTVINCMDGRVQLPVNQYLQKRFEARYVDTITEAGPVGVLSEIGNEETRQRIMDRVRISVEKHDSVGAAVVGHYDCAGNPVSEEVQKEQILKGVEVIQKSFKELEVVGLWVDSDWKVHEVT